MAKQIEALQTKGKLKQHLMSHGYSVYKELHISNINANLSVDLANSKTILEISTKQTYIYYYYFIITVIFFYNKVFLVN